MPTPGLVNIIVVGLIFAGIILLVGLVVCAIILLIGTARPVGGWWQRKHRKSYASIYARHRF